MAPRKRSRSLRELPLLRGLVHGWEDLLTARGRYLFAVVAVFGLVGFDTRKSQVYVLFAMAVGALLPALFYEAAPRPKVHLSCDLPLRATAGTPVDVAVRASSLGGREDDLRVDFPRPRPGTPPVSVVPREAFLSVRPGHDDERTFTLLFARRGRYELRGPVARATDPFRLAGGGPVRSEDATVLVYPRFYRLDGFSVPLGRRYQPGGIPLTSHTGDAIEFVGTREYRLGDSLRNIHWRSWARVGEPVVREYQEEYFCRIAIVLDTFVPRRARAAGRAAFEAGISVVASIADAFSRSEYVVDILAAGPDVYEVSSGRSLAYLENILDVLACLEPCPDPPFAAIGPALFEKLAQITTVVAVLQDWDEPRERFLRQVKAQGTAVRAIVVKEGRTARPWEAAADEVGEISVMAPADVERALAAGPPGR